MCVVRANQNFRCDSLQRISGRIQHLRLAVEAAARRFAVGCGAAARRFAVGCGAAVVGSRGCKPEERQPIGCVKLRRSDVLNSGMWKSTPRHSAFANFRHPIRGFGFSRSLTCGWHHRLPTSAAPQPIALPLITPIIKERIPWSGFCEMLAFWALLERSYTSSA